MNPGFNSQCARMYIFAKMFQEGCASISPSYFYTFSRSYFPLILFTIRDIPPHSPPKPT